MSVDALLEKTWNLYELVTVSGNNKEYQDTGIDINIHIQNLDDNYGSDSYGGQSALIKAWVSIENLDDIDIGMRLDDGDDILYEIQAMWVKTLGNQDHIELILKEIFD